MDPYLEDVDLTIRATDRNGAAVLAASTFGPATGGDGDSSPDARPQPVVSIVEVKHTGATAAGYFLVARLAAPGQHRVCSLTSRLGS